MALTVTSDLTVITNGNDGTWTDIGGGSGSAAETDYFVQGTGSRSRAVSGGAASRGMAVDIGATTLDFSSGGANEDELVYFWIQCYTPGLVDNLATAPGLRIRLSEGGAGDPDSDFAEWDIAYSDLLADTNLPGNEFFRVYVLDPRAPPTRTTGTWDYNAVRHFGAVLDTNATAKGQNLGIDRICHGRGELIVYGTPDDVNGGFGEIIEDAWNTIDDSVAIGSTATARHGIISVRGGVAFVQGKLVFGDDAGTNATDFTGIDQAFQWEETRYYDGTRIRTAVGYDDSQEFTGRDSNGVAYNGISVVGNGTGDTDVDFGVIVGTEQGRSGPTFVGARKTPTELDGDDGAVESFQVYGTIFADFRTLDMSANVATDDWLSNTHKSCGTFLPGPITVRNTNFLTGLGGAYTFYENFVNVEGAADEDLSVADPTVSWIKSLGVDLIVPSADAGYVELTNSATQEQRYYLGFDPVTTDDHYVDCIIFFPSSGGAQGTLGPTIAVGNSGADNFYFEIDLVNDHVELFRNRTISIAGSGGAGDFTMDEDEEYQLLLRRNGTTIEAYISGNSAADGQHTLKLSATDANLVGNQRFGIFGVSSTSQTGDGPRISRYGGGPITDDLGSLLFPATASDDAEDCSFIQCSRALSYNTAGTYTHVGMNVSSPLAGGHNDSGGLITGNFSETTDVPDDGNVENTGISTTTFEATVTLTVQVDDENGDPVSGARVRIEEDPGGTLVSEGSTNGSGTFSDSYSFVSDQDVLIKVRLKGFKNFRTSGTITNTGLTVGVRFVADTIVDLP